MTQSSRIPIVIPNYGPGNRQQGFTEPHVNYALAQARFSNPDAHTVVIGDADCRESLWGFESEFVWLAEFDDSWRELKANYVHFSPNTPWFELFAIAKWFIIRDWMKRSGCERCLHIDPDLMLYATLDEIVTANGPALIMSSMGRGTHCSLVTYDILCRLCDLVLRTYGDPEEVRNLARAYEAGTLIVQDMTFFERLCRQLPSGSVFDSLKCPLFFDHNFTGDIGGPFVKEGEIRKVRFEGVRAFGERSDGTPVRFASLHFQGAGKAQMHKHLATDDSDRTGKGFIRALRANCESLRFAAIDQKTLAKYASRLGEIRSSSEDLGKLLRQIESSPWIRVGSTLNLTKARGQLQKCKEIREKIRDLAPRLEQ